MKHLEKQKKQLQQEEEELHEQVAHSQEIIEKLTDVEDELKEQLEAEIKDKEYLQECLDETGHILFQLKNNEQKLLRDKDTLLDDLEAEVEVTHFFHCFISLCTHDSSSEHYVRIVCFSSSAKQKKQDKSEENKV